jgi:hypothetical protein
MLQRRKPLVLARHWSSLWLLGLVGACAYLPGDALVVVSGVLAGEAQDCSVRVEGKKISYSKPVAPGEFAIAVLVSPTEKEYAVRLVCAGRMLAEREPAPLRELIYGGVDLGRIEASHIR